MKHGPSNCTCYTHYFIYLLFAIKEKGGPLILSLLQPWMLYDLISEDREEPGAASGVSTRNQSRLWDSMQEILHEQGPISPCRWPGHNQREPRARADAFWKGKQGSAPFGTPNSTCERVETGKWGEGGKEWDGSHHPGPDHLSCHWYEFLTADL